MLRQETFLTNIESLMPGLQNMWSAVRRFLLSEETFPRLLISNAVTVVVMCVIYVEKCAYLFDLSMFPWDIFTSRYSDLRRNSTSLPVSMATLQILRQCAVVWRPLHSLHLSEEDFFHLLKLAAVVIPVECFVTCLFPQCWRGPGSKRCWPGSAQEVKSTEMIQLLFSTTADDTFELT